jgi:hypothetical protein
MSQINPITGSIVQASTVQRQQSTDKVRQMRHAQDLRRNSAAADEEDAEQSVSSSDELKPAGDREQPGKQRKDKSPPHRDSQDDNPDSEEKHLDLRV